MLCSYDAQVRMLKFLKITWYWDRLGWLATEIGGANWSASLATCWYCWVSWMSQHVGSLWSWHWCVQNKVVTCRRIN